MLLSRHSVVTLQEMKGHERAIINQANVGTFSKATLGIVLRDRGGVDMGFPEHVDIILN